MGDVSLLRALPCLLTTLGCTASAVVGTGGADGTTGGTSTSASPSGSTGGPGVTSTTGSTTVGSASITSSVTSTSSTGSGGCVPADCADGVPCTIDTCDLATATCNHAPRAAGEPGDLSEGPCEGVCQTDATCGLAIYRRDLANASWTRDAVSELWTGANAPPPRGILGAEGGSVFAVVVVADDGMVYRRSGGTWVAPASGQTLFGIDTNLTTAVLGSSFDGTDYVTLAFVEGGLRKLVTATVTAATWEAGPAVEGIELTGYPSQSQRMDWAVTMMTAGEGLVQWYRFEDQMVYRWSANGFNGALPEAMSDAWGDPATAPAANTVRDALAIGTELQLIAP